VDFNKSASLLYNAKGSILKGLSANKDKSSFGGRDEVMTMTGDSVACELFE